jgi:hypothetical protein
VAVHRSTLLADLYCPSSGLDWARWTVRMIATLAVVGA